VLLAGGREILAGPAEHIFSFANRLNADPPPADQLQARVRAMIAEIPGCSFAPAGIMLAARVPP
jgi:hypothetical protein